MTIVNWTTIAFSSTDCAASVIDVLDGWCFAGGNSQASIPSSEAVSISQTGRPPEHPHLHQQLALPPPMAGQLHLQPESPRPPAVTPPVPPTPRLEDNDSYSSYQLSVPIGSAPPRPAETPTLAPSQLHVHPSSSRHEQAHPPSQSMGPSASVRYFLQRLCFTVHCTCSMNN
jgi:hypothetical protein